MTTRPETAGDFADSNKCICCKRSKSGGSFFEIKSDVYRNSEGVLAGSPFLYGSWDANIDVFEEASRQGCQRCAVAFDMVTTWKKNNPRNDWRWITAYNGDAFHSMVASVLVDLSESRKDRYAYGKNISLEILSANHRNPIGLLENFKNRWNIVTKPLSYEDPTSDDELEGCIERLRHCLDYHAYCTATLSKLPKRVLELDSTSITLRDTAPIPSKELYACLSHCWGPKGPSLQLTSATETCLRQGVDANSLPRTFSETAKVCLKLGIRYLWIDALCIIQGDKTDWTEAAATMSDIYENAFVTIAATCAANSDDGLRPFRDFFKALRLGSSNFFVRRHISDRSTIHSFYQTKFWPLLSRAWAFQEGKLAPRILRFSCYGVIWDCRTSRAEAEKQGVGHDLDDNTIDLLPFFSPLSSTSDSKRAWHNIVREYTTLNLTYRTDTLPAIAALAQRMAKLRRNDTYLAGMWRSTLLSDIQWRTVNDYLQESSYYPRQESGLPTWSWVTKRGPFYPGNRDTLHGVEILGLDYTPVGPAEIGAIKDAVLTMRGHTLPLQVEATKSGHEYKFRISHQAVSWSEQELVYTPDYKPSPDFNINGSQAFLALFISGDEFSLEGFVLRQVGTTYERVGWFHFFAHMQKQASESLMERIAQLPLTTVRII